MHFANVPTATKARTQLRKVKLYTWVPSPPALTPTFLSWPLCAAQKIILITFGTDHVRNSHSMDHTTTYRSFSIDHVPINHTEWFMLQIQITHSMDHTNYSMSHKMDHATKHNSHSMDHAQTNVTQHAKTINSYTTDHATSY